MINPIVFFNKVVQWVYQTPEKEVQRYIYGAIAGTIVAMLSIAIFCYFQADRLVKEINDINKIAKSAGPIIARYERIQAEEEHLQVKLEKNQNEDFRSFFETFCKDLGLIPQPKWSPVSVGINQKFEEVLIQAEFTGQSTQKLVEMLDSIEKEAVARERILYIKNVHVKKDPSGNTISFDLTIATVRIKKEVQE